ncbi:MAG: prepilin-type N-terminal cleavage/methylation domain-containing protein [Planctomycetota bacterium]|nr:prepilin-type N-terminal cleavage/methylation domain-containing protein [Planctomycetota bacterium]
MRSRGFTLAELLIVLMVLSISVMAVIPLAGTDELTDVRAAAELLASDIEDTQARNLATPDAPTCLVPSKNHDGWHLALSEHPEQPITSASGAPHQRRFGSGALSTAATLRMSGPNLPDDGLRFDDQGAPLMGDSPIQFTIEGIRTGQRAYITLSTATGRVSIAIADD